MTVNKTYAEEFALLLDAALPEWGLAAPPSRSALEQRRCFSFQVPGPSATVKCPLAVTVTPSEITVEFHDAQNHFANPHEAVAQIRALIEETEIVETTYYSSRRPTDCGFVVVNPFAPGPFPVRGMTRIVRRSWRGTYDIDMNVA